MCFEVHVHSGGEGSPVTTPCPHRLLTSNIGLPNFSSARHTRSICLSALQLWPNLAVRWGLFLVITSPYFSTKTNFAGSCFQGWFTKSYGYVTLMRPQEDVTSMEPRSVQQLSGWRWLTTPMTSFWCSGERGEMTTIALPDGGLRTSQVPGGKRGLERWNVMFKVTQPVNGRMNVWTEGCFIEEQLPLTTKLKSQVCGLIHYPLCLCHVFFFFS